MIRRLLALACALALLAPALPSAWAGEAAGPYEHVWQAEGQAGGDLGGGSRRIVSRDEMDLALSGTGVVGHLSYADALGVESSSGDVTAQRASIEITLTGSPGEGGAVAAGTFTGQAALITQAIPSLDTLDGIEALSSGVQVVYEVSGHWGARISGGVADGELIYERATPQSGSDAGAAAHTAEWFNRLGSGPAGGPQTFRVEVGRLAEEPAGGAAKGGRARAASAAVVPVADAERPKYGPLGYVLRGLRGRPGLPAAPVSLSLSERARALKEAKPPGATSLPEDAVAMDVDVTGAYLDAKNHAAKLIDERGPTGRAGSLTLAWETAQSTALLRRKPPTAKELADQLRTQAGVPGATELAGDLGGVDEGLLQVWASVIGAVGAKQPAASVLGPTTLAEAAVIDTELPRTGPSADAVRVAALDAGAPAASLRVTTFRRTSSDDASGTTAGGLLPNRVLARNAVKGTSPATLTYRSSSGDVRLAPESWPAYQRSDGAEYWLAGEGSPYALTDGTLRGAGFTIPRAYLVDAKHVGRILAVYNLR